MNINHHIFPDGKRLLFVSLELGLSGLKLNLSHLQLRPDDERLKPLYQLCQEPGLYPLLTESWVIGAIHNFLEQTVLQPV